MSSPEPARRCCIVNASSHRIPDTVFAALNRVYGFTYADVASVPFDVSFHPEAEPIEAQVASYLQKVAEHRIKPFEHPGPHFLLVPGISAAAALVTVALCGRLNTFPVLIVVARNPQTGTYEFHRFVDLATWYRHQRCNRPLQNGTVTLCS